MLTFLNRIISICFYALFLVVPLTFTGDTSELFEFNKMWLTYGLAIVILVAWIAKMLMHKRFLFQRTPLDIPIALFVLSQIISTIFSLDSYVSFWGYYSRFNGGLLSTLTYVFLYYAFVSNVNLKQIIRYLLTSVVAGVLVALWGLPSHFGYDPTCLVFRGTFDVSCWTTAFQPKVRIFSTLGQPDWLSAYLVLLTPISFAFGMWYAKQKKLLWSILLFAATFLFYLDNLYTRARSGFIGMMVALVIVIGWYIWSERKIIKRTAFTKLFSLYRLPLITIIVFLIVTFFLGTSIAQIDKFSYSGIQQFFATRSAPAAPTKPATQSAAVKPAQNLTGGELGGTDSGKIRLFVWEGALRIFAAHPFFGTGVETYAYAYYLFRPAGHNLTSEWDYLYNKAHNEYLNFLATTGAFGLGTYLLMLGLFLFLAVKYLVQKKEKSAEDKSKNYAFEISEVLQDLLLPALIASYASILVTDFFGFSVVNTNIYLFLIPGFFFFIQGLLRPKYDDLKVPKEVNAIAWLGMSVCTFVGIYLIIVLIQYRNADIAYALGQNLDHAGEYQQAYPLLHQAVQERPDEPVFQDELTINDAVLASALASQHDSANANKLAQEAITISNNIVTQHPNSVVYWKTRVRVAYTLSQYNPQYLQTALDAIEKAHTLAPTDAKISYNLGLMYGQAGQIDKAVTTLENTVALKKDYKEAYYALGIYYRQQAVAGDGKTVINPEKEQKAAAMMHIILDNFDPNDKQSLDNLKAWGEK